MENILLTLLLIVVGLWLKKLAVFPRNTAVTLNLFVIYISLPALVLLKIPHLEFSYDVLVTVIMPWFLVLISAAIVVMMAKLLYWSRETLAALLLVVPLGNTSFLGIPMVQAFFGEQAVAYALVYDQLGSFLALAIYGSLIITLFSKQGKTFSFKLALQEIITFPPFIALILALVLSTVSLSPLYFSLLSPMAATLVPVVMIAVGFQLDLKIDKLQVAPLLLGLSVKMVIAPALVFLIFHILGLRGLIYQVTIFEAAMPPMISAGALAIMANFSAKLTASMVAYGIFLSFITLPLLHYLLTL